MEFDLRLTFDPTGGNNSPPVSSPSLSSSVDFEPPSFEDQNAATGDTKNDGPLAPLGEEDQLMPVAFDQSAPTTPMLMKRSMSVPEVQFTGLGFFKQRKAPIIPASISLSPKHSPDEEETTNSEKLSGPMRHRHLSFSTTVGSETSFTGAVPSSLRRLHEIRRESSVKVAIACDYANEKLFRTASQVSSGWDEQLTLDDNPNNTNSRSSIDQETECRAFKRERTTSLTEPVHILTSFLPSSCSPSPNRTEKQCYSPSMNQIVRHNVAFSPCPSPTPSPTRRNFCNRSLSPIAAVKPLSLSLKRKFLDDRDSDTEGGSSPKRVHSNSCSVTPDRCFAGTSQALQHSAFSWSVGSMDSVSSASSTISATGQFGSCSKPATPNSFSPEIIAPACLFPPSSSFRTTAITQKSHLATRRLLSGFLPLRDSPSPTLGGGDLWNPGSHRPRSSSALVVSSTNSSTGFLAPSPSGFDSDREDRFSEPEPLSFDTEPSCLTPEPGPDRMVKTVTVLEKAEEDAESCAKMDDADVAVDAICVDEIYT